MKHIIIDARLYGPVHTGLGRYTKNLLVALKELPDFKQYKFTLLVYPELFHQIRTDLKDNFRYVITPLRHYSLAEQIFLPVLLARLQPDLVHFTHLDKPILYFGRSVVTVHDLIRHFSKGRETTTHYQFLYWFKYLGYLFMTKIIFLTSRIIVPSNFWRDYIINNFSVKHQNIITTYEAVDPSFLTSLRGVHPRSNPVSSNYVLYTGNLYPHKNIDIILKALQKLPKLKLKIICSRPLFKDRIDNLINKYKLKNQVEFLGYLTDGQFATVYHQALALVHPALIEGFGLTGLEAMALNCPVISSSSSCLPEIYQDSVLYFNPHNPADLINQIKKLKSSAALRSDLINHGHQLVKSYSWTRTARQTLNFYTQLLNDKN